jgi:hypothetical protein
MTVLFLSRFFFFYTLCVCWTLSFLPPTPKISKLWSVLWTFTNSQLSICFSWELHEVFWCSNLCYYILHWFSSDILLLQSVSAFFVITRNQYQCDKIQNCIKCFVPQISYSHPAECSLECWKQPTFILNNMEIIGCL